MSPFIYHSPIRNQPGVKETFFQITSYALPATKKNKIIIFLFFSSPFSTFSPDIHHGSEMCEIILSQQHRPDYQHICSFNSFSQFNWIPATATLPNDVKYNLSAIFSSSLFAYSLHYKEFRNMHQGKLQWNLIVGLIRLENNTLFL